MLDKLPLAVVPLVLAHLDNSPYTYLKFARISPAWRPLFLSDFLWEKFNVYNLESGISLHFIDSPPLNFSSYSQHIDLLHGTPRLEHQYLRALAAHYINEPRTYQNLYLQLIDLLHYRPVLGREYLQSIDARVWHKWLQPCLTNNVLNRYVPESRTVRRLLKFIPWDLLQEPANRTILALRDEIKFSMIEDPAVAMAAFYHFHYYCKRNDIGSIKLAEHLASDRNLILRAAHIDGRTVKLADPELQSDRDIMVAACSNGPYPLGYPVPAKFSDDDELMALIVKWDSFMLRCTPPRLRDDREFFKNIISRKKGRTQNYCTYNYNIVPVRDSLYIGNHLLYASERLQNDRELVLMSVADYGLGLAHASIELRNDRQVVLTALRGNVGVKDTVLQYASWPLRNDREIVLTAVTLRSRELAYASEKLRGNREVVLAATKGATEPTNTMLQYASEALRDDPLVVFAAASLRGRELAHASKMLRSDYKLVKSVVLQHGIALRYASAWLGSDRGLNLTALSTPTTLEPSGNLKDLYTLHDVPPAFDTDRDIVLAAVAAKGYTLCMAPEYHTDSRAVLAAAQNHGFALYTIPSYQGSRELALATVSNHGYAFSRISYQFHADREIILKAIQSPGIAQVISINEVQAQVHRDDFDILLAAVADQKLVLSIANDSPARLEAGYDPQSAADADRALLLAFNRRIVCLALSKGTAQARQLAKELAQGPVARHTFRVIRRDGIRCG